MGQVLGSADPTTLAGSNDEYPLETAAVWARRKLFPLAAPKCDPE